MTAFVYFHIELDSHDAAFAEGAPSETFMDDGSRGMVPNAQDCYRRPPAGPGIRLLQIVGRYPTSSAAAPAMGAWLITGRSSTVIRSGRPGRQPYARVELVHRGPYSASVLLCNSPFQGQWQSFWLVLTMTGWLRHRGPEADYMRRQHPLAVRTDIRLYVCVNGPVRAGK